MPEREGKVWERRTGRWRGERGPCQEEREGGECRGKGEGVLAAPKDGGRENHTAQGGRGGPCHGEGEGLAMPGKEEGGGVSSREGGRGSRARQTREGH